MADDDFYKVLGVAHDASQADIQKAYRDLARKYHPDMNPDDAKAKEKFQQVQHAYDVLSNPEKRELYDRYGSSFEEAGAHPGGGTWRRYQGSGPSGHEEIDLSELFGQRGGDGDFAGGGFGDFFRQFGQSGGQGRRQAQRPRRGANLKHRLEIPFETAIRGGEARLTVARPQGNTETITVKIPAGIEHGKKIRVRGQGEPGGDSGPPGDILIEIQVASHPCYRRRGQHLEVEVPITVQEAALGGKVDVPTPKGTITLTIPPGTSSGKKFRIKGHGVQSSSPGDLYAEVKIVLPDNLNDRAIELINELSSFHTTDPRENLRW